MRFIVLTRHIHGVLENAIANASVVAGRIRGGGGGVVEWRGEAEKKNVVIVAAARVRVAHPPSSVTMRYRLSKKATKLVAVVCVLL